LAKFNSTQEKIYLNVGAVLFMIHDDDHLKLGVPLKGNKNIDITSHCCAELFLWFMITGNFM